MDTEAGERLLKVMERGARAQWWRRYGTKEEGFVIRRHHPEYELEEVALLKLFQTQPTCLDSTDS